MKAKRKYLIDPILGFHWLLQYGGTEKEALLWYTNKFKLLPPIFENKNAGCFANNDAVLYTGLIWVQKGGAASTMCHEIAHAVMHVCRVLELDPREADEFQASYTGYLGKHFTNLFYK